MRRSVCVLIFTKHRVSIKKGQQCILLSEFTELHAEGLLLRLIDCSSWCGGIYCRPGANKRFLARAVVKIIVDPKKAAVIKNLRVIRGLSINFHAVTCTSTSPLSCMYCSELSACMRVSTGIAKLTGTDRLLHLHDKTMMEEDCLLIEGQVIITIRPYIIPETPASCRTAPYYSECRTMISMH